MAQTLITVQDVMDAGNLNNDTLRPRITSLLASVFAAAEAYCVRKFSSDTFTEHFNGSGQASVIVANPPIVSLLSVVDDAQYSARAIATSANVLTLTEYKERGEVKLYKAEGGFSGGEAGVQVAYVGGWSATTLPADLKQAIMDEVLYRLNERTVGIKQQAADGVSMIADERNGFAGGVCAVLDRYRLWWKGFG